MQSTLNQSQEWEHVISSSHDTMNTEGLHVQDVKGPHLTWKTEQDSQCLREQLWIKMEHLICKKWVNVISLKSVRVSVYDLFIWVLNSKVGIWSKSSHPAISCKQILVFTELCSMGLLCGEHQMGFISQMRHVDLMTMVITYAILIWYAPKEKKYYFNYFYLRLRMLYLGLKTSHINSALSISLLYRHWLSLSPSPAILLSPA